MITGETKEKLRETVTSVRKSAEQRLVGAPRESVLFSCRAELRRFIAEGLEKAKAFEGNIELEPAEFDELRRFMNVTIARYFEEEFGAPF